MTLRRGRRPSTCGYRPVRNRVRARSLHPKLSGRSLRAMRMNGLEFMAGRSSDRRALTVRDAQHEYVLTEK